jgi:radical SAM protein with 4Fe4S-binding SPASM domain
MQRLVSLRARSLDGRIREATGLDPAEFYAALNRRSPRPVVVFDIDVGCDRRCIHCLARVKGGADLDAVRTSIVSARRLGYGTFLYPTEPAVEARTIPLYALAGEDYLITNGIRTEPLLDQIHAAGVRKLGVSLHGPDPQTHSLLTGHPEDFDRIVSTIEHATGRFAVQIKTVMHRRNLRQLDRHLHLARQLGATEVQLLNLLRTGSAEQLPESMFLTPDDAMDVVRTVLAFADHDRPPRIAFGATWGPNFHSRGVYRWLLGNTRADLPDGNRWCPAGRTYFTVVGKDVYCCPNWTAAADLVVGKWSDERGIHLTEDRWQCVNSEDLVGMCAPDNCEYSRICQGGCRLSAWAHSRQPNGSPPFCLTRILDELREK